MQNRRETRAQDARRRTHSKLEPSVCLKIGEACTSSAFCLIGKRMTSSVPSLGIQVSDSVLAPPATVLTGDLS